MPNVGKEFENQIRSSIKKVDNLYNLYYLRLQDPPQSFNQNENTTLRFSNKNPYDFLMYHKPYLYTIENKSKSSNRLSFSMDKKNKSVDIKAHQIDGLFESYKKGAISGLLINFRDSDTTYFLHIMDFMNFIIKTTKKSINEKDIQDYNGIIIPQTKKIKKFDYDISFLLEKCEEKYEDYYKKIPLKKDNSE